MTGELWWMYAMPSSNAAHTLLSLSQNKPRTVLLSRRLSRLKCQRQCPLRSMAYMPFRTVPIMNMESLVMTARFTRCFFSSASMSVFQGVMSPV